jgi:hypothetical protein
VIAFRRRMSHPKCIVWPSGELPAFLAAAAAAGPGVPAAAAVLVAYLDGRESVWYASKSIIHAFPFISSLTEGKIVPREQNTVEAMGNTGDVHTAASLLAKALNYSHSIPSVIIQSCYPVGTMWHRSVSSATSAAE